MCVSRQLPAHVLIRLEPLAEQAPELVMDRRNLYVHWSMNDQALLGHIDREWQSTERDSAVDATLTRKVIPLIDRLFLHCYAYPQ